MRARLLVLLLLLGVLDGLAGAAFHVTCRDGETTGVVRGPAGHRRYPLCDLDGACDGVCTFSFEVECTSCYLNLDVSGPRMCTPDSDAACVPFLGSPPCPPQSPLYTVALEGAAARRRIVHIPRDGRVPRATVVFRCRAPKPGRCGTATTTTLPPNPDFTGDWIFTETEVDDHCPVGAGYGAAPNTGPVAILQTGDSIKTCGNSLVPRTGSVSGATMILGDGVCCTASGPAGSYNFSEELTGGLSASSGQIEATAEWHFTPTAMPPGRSECRRSSTALFTRVAPASCVSDGECLAANPCQRCRTGVCTRIPECW